MIQYRQGDVLITRVEGTDAVAHVDREAKPLAAENARAVLAHGELTGHHHSTPAGVSALLEMPSGERFLRVWGACSLEHQEHAPIDLEPGLYRVTRQREYVPAEVPRPVAD